MTVTASRRTQHPPVRLAHLGLGAFHRSHQAWFTEETNIATGDLWGIAAFTGRSPRAAELLARNDGVYTLLERSAEGDRAQIIQAIVRAESGQDDARWLAVLTDPNLSVLTVTVTESGYSSTAFPPSRIARGLVARHAVDAGPIAVVSCDNLLGNGRVLRDAVLSAAGRHAEIVARTASFVDTVVDRITPEVTPADLARVQEIVGWDDPSAVVTEPTAEWVLAGEFPAGRPEWERAGARFVGDVRPYEERKLWLLNAGHSFLAAAGRLAGYETIAEAYADAQMRATLEELWAEQRVMIELTSDEIDRWLTSVGDRFANPRIVHRLDQIARGSAIKMALRLVAPIRRRAEAGLPAGDAQLSALDSWVRSLLELEPLDEPARSLAVELSSIDKRDRVRSVIDHLGDQGVLQ